MYFDDGSNKLGLYFVGLSGVLMIDNISITKGESSINYVLNGDFEMNKLAPGEQVRVFLGKIPGWTAPQISLRRTASGGSQLVLTTQSRSTTQSITFGKVRNY